MGRWLLRPVLWVLRLGISKKRLLRRSRNNIKVTAWYGADILSFLVFLVGACTLLCRQFGSNASVDDLLESVKECHSPRSSILNNITMDFVESVYSCFAPSNVNHLSTITFFVVGRRIHRCWQRLCEWKNIMAKEEVRLRCNHINILHRERTTNSALDPSSSCISEAGENTVICLDNRHSFTRHTCLTEFSYSAFHLL